MIPHARRDDGRLIDFLVEAWSVSLRHVYDTIVRCPADYIILFSQVSKIFRGTIRGSTINGRAGIADTRAQLI